MNHIELPIEQKPALMSYHYAAFPLSIIQGNGKDNVIPWLCKKGINCCFDIRPWMNRFHVGLFDISGVNDGILHHQHIYLSKNMYSQLKIDMLQLLLLSLNEESYISGYCNERYIPSKNAYKQFDYMHDYLLYGYDDKERVFYSLGYTDTMMYQSYKIPYDSMKESLDKSIDNKIEFNLWNYNKDYSCKLDLDSIVKELDDYINSINSKDGWKKYFVFGLDAMDSLRQCFCDFREVDLRYTRAFVEHKYLMLMRLNYLSNLFESEIKAFAEAYAKIYNQAVLIHNLGIKYAIIQKDRTLNSILDYMDEIINYERNNIPQINNVLRRFVNKEEND